MEQPKNILIMVCQSNQISKIQLNFHSAMTLII